MRGYKNYCTKKFDLMFDGIKFSVSSYSNYADKEIKKKQWLKHEPRQEL
ncbi:MAG: hypothetical protein LBP40_03715 [Campylobacteraceae bacterium]|nr:hypothetical protein [Campylobacteraceae bacterium]